MIDYPSGGYEDEPSLRHESSEYLRLINSPIPPDLCREPDCDLPRYIGGEGGGCLEHEIKWWLETVADGDADSADRQLASREAAKLIADRDRPEYQQFLIDRQYAGRVSVYPY